MFFYPLSSIIRGSNVIQFPDFFTQNSDPKLNFTETKLIKEILIAAKGRPIVCLTGYLCWTKGIVEFTFLIKSISMKNIFFVICGSVDWGGETKVKNKKNLVETWESSENCFSYLKVISDLSTNLIIKNSTVVFAAYRDFPHSSNILTKSAFLNIPIIVSDGHLMAERVKEYHLGEVVSEGNVFQMIKTLQYMVSIEYKSNSNNSLSKKYKLFHSVDRLPDCFKRLLLLN